MICHCYSTDSIPILVLVKKGTKKGFSCEEVHTKPSGYSKVALAYGNQLQTSARAGHVLLDQPRVQEQHIVHSF